MAEAIAVLALVASVTAVVDFSLKIISRVRDCAAQATDVPKTFRSLADRLPLLIKALQQVQARAQAGNITSDAAKDLNVLVNGILDQIDIIQQCLDRFASAAGASRFDRMLNGLKSVAKDEKVKEAVEKIHHDIGVLVLHQTTNTADVSDRILQELKRLNLQSPSSQQYVPNHVEKQTFGLCLGQAPLIESDAFVGRQPELQQLHEWLSQSQNAQAQRVVSITGMGGLGKTQLSLAYVREYGGQYSSVFWIDAKDITSLRQSMSALTATIFSFSTDAAANPDEETAHIDKVRRWLSEAWNDQWMIIFDNYDDPSLPNIRSQTGYDIRQFFPTRAQGSILITTRSSKLAFSKQLKLQKIEDMDRCIDIISHRSGREMMEDQDSRRLVERLDGLPLALTVAGTYLGQVDASCAEYLNFYETAWSDLHGADSEELMEYEDRTLSSTWTISLDQIRRQDADAAELLQFWGYLNNEDIWYDLIKAGADKGPSWIGRLTADKIRFNRAMSKLVDYSLVEVKDGLYRIHPCLHDWISEQLNVPLSEPLLFTAIACVRSTLPDARHPQYWIMGRRLVKHVNRIQHQRFAVLWDTNKYNKDILDASHSFGSLFQRLCVFDKAEEIYLRALAGKEKILGPDHTSTLSTVDSLGSLYSSQDKPDQAEAMYTRALTGYEAKLGLDHTSTLQTVKNRGVLYHIVLKQLDKAEEWYTRALTGYEKALGPDHFSTLETAAMLASLYHALDKLDKAEELHLRTLTASEKVLGLDHYSTTLVVSNLGYLYHTRGKLDEAEAMFIRALANKERMLGLDHLETLKTVNNLGLVHLDRGDLDKAEVMFTRALAGFEKLLGPDHTSTLLAASNLGILLQTQDKLDEAEVICMRTLAGYEKVFGPNHISTLMAISNVGAICHCQGMLDDAQEMYTRALAGREKVLGLDHTSTLETVFNLGMTYEHQGKLVEAEAMYSRALAGREKKLGLDHTSTLECVYNLGEVHEKQSKLVQAEEKYVRALAGLEKQLGRDHFYTSFVLITLGSLYALRGKVEDARRLLLDALTMFSRIFGSLDTLHQPAIHGYAEALSRSIRIAESDFSCTRNHLTNLVSCFERQGFGTMRVTQSLAKTLANFEDDENARLAFVHSLTKPSKVSDLSGTCCRGCHHRLTANMGLHVCRRCLDISLCDNCMSAYAMGTLTVPTCSDHKFCSFSEAVQKAFKPPTIQNKSDREAWLRELKRKYQLNPDT